MKHRAPVIAAIALALVAASAHAAGREAAVAGQDRALARELTIHDLLLEKMGERALGVRVTVDRRRAILTGEVPSRPDRGLAEEIALSVDGIKSVDNQLEVRSPPGSAAPKDSLTQELADAQLEARVKRRLFGEIGKWARRVEVEAVEGVVSLRGTLPDGARKQLALDTAEGTQGVQRVVDLIQTGG